MPLPDPLPAAEFLDRLQVSGIRFDLAEAVEMSRTAGGARLSADIGDRLWMGEIILASMEPREADFAHARINLLRGGGRRFLVHDTRRPFPTHDPDGTLLGAAVPTIAALDAGDRRLIGLRALPPGYRLAIGDYLSYAYAGGRRALHIVQEEVAADGTGRTPLFEILPLRRIGAAVAAPVQIVRASCHASIDPGGSTVGDSRRTVTQGTSLTWTQDPR